MKKNKPILKEIIRLLGVLQANDSELNGRGVIAIYGRHRFENRTVELCQRGDYIEGSLEGGYRITIKGIEFLEKHKDIKNQQELRKSQVFLTFALFTTAFFQGIMLMVYYCFDLGVRGFTTKSWILGISGILILGFILFAFNKLRRVLS